MISICVGTRNRSTSLLTNLIPSLNKCKLKKDIALSICNCHSDDIPNLESRIRKLWRGKLYYTNSKTKFTRSSSLNIAVRQSKEPILFICDCDISVPDNLVELMTKNITLNRVWYPICFSLYVNRPKIIQEDNGKWRRLGFGIVGIHRKKFNAMKGYSETFKEWGGEDTYMYKSTTGTIIRSQCEGLFHNWHPEDLEYKNRYYNT